MYITLKSAEYRLYSLAVQHYYLVTHKHLSMYEIYNSVYYIKYEVLKNWTNGNQNDLLRVKITDDNYHKIIKALSYFGDYMEEDDTELINIFNRLANKLLYTQRRN